MKIVDIQEISNYARSKLMDVEETALMLNLLFPVEVNEFLESYTLDYTDFEMICEIVNQLKLHIIQVNDEDNIRFLNMRVVA